MHGSARQTPNFIYAISQDGEPSTTILPVYLQNWLDELDDILGAPLSDDLYDYHKPAIVHRTMDLESSRLREVTKAEELSDCRSTWLLHLMRWLLGLRPSDDHDDILHEFFVQ